MTILDNLSTSLGSALIGAIVGRVVAWFLGRWSQARTDSFQRQLLTKDAAQLLTSELSILRQTVLEQVPDSILDVDYGHPQVAFDTPIFREVTSSGRVASLPPTLTIRIHKLYGYIAAINSRIAEVGQNSDVHSAADAEGTYGDTWTRLLEERQCFLDNLPTVLEELRKAGQAT